MTLWDFHTRMIDGLDPELEYVAIIDEKTGAHYRKVDSKGTIELGGEFWGSLKSLREQEVVWIEVVNDVLRLYI